MPPFANPAPAPRRSQSYYVAALIFAAFICLYLLTYSAIFKSDDEHLYVSVGISLGSSGTLSNRAMYGMKGSIAEPLQAVAVAALYQLTRLGHIGAVHAFFLLNAFVFALTAAVVFALVRRRGHRAETAAFLAVAFGAGTLAWPHAKLLFRDPLATLFTAAAVLCFEAVGRQTRRSAQIGLAILTTLLAGGALLSKTTAAPVVLAIVIAAFARLAHQIPLRRAAVISLAGAALLAAVLVVVTFLFRDVASLMSARFSNAFQLVVGRPITEEFFPAILGMLISPGKGLFIESPILLLAIFAIPATARRDWRLLIVPWLGLGLLVLVIARYQDYLWWGGTGWGVRHLLPVVPLLAAAGAPIVDHLFEPGRRYAKLSIWTLLGLSILIQVGAATALPAYYYSWIAPLAGNAAWTTAIWNPLYAEAVGHWVQLFLGHAPDFAWLRIMPANAGPVIAVVVAYLVAFGAAAVLLWRSLTRSIGRREMWAGGALTLAVATLLPVLLLKAYYPDPFYFFNRQNFRGAITYLEQNARPGDAIVVRGYLHPIWYAFLNYFHSPVPWYIVRGTSPTAGEVEALRFSQEPERALDPLTRQLFNQELPGRYDRIWFVTDEGTPGGGFRLEEWRLSQISAPVKTEHPAGEGLVDISLFGLASPASASLQTTAVTFGDQIRLMRAAVLPFSGRAVYRPSDILPVSLHWSVTARPQVDYNVGVYLLDASGVLKAQQDGQAGFGFRSTSVWLPGQDIVDHHGLELPPGLPPGEYYVAVAVYDWHVNQRLPARDATGALPDDLALISTVNIEAR